MMPVARRLGRPPRDVLDDMEAVPDRRQRIAQLVGQDRDELVLAVIEVAKLLDEPLLRRDAGTQLRFGALALGHVEPTRSRHRCGPGVDTRA